MAPLLRPAMLEHIPNSLISWLHIYLIYCVSFLVYEMELQLGLALPVHHSNPVKGFDLNHEFINGSKEAALLLSSEPWSYGGCLGTQKCFKNKRTSDEAFGMIGDLPPPFPLMLWNGHPNEDDDRKAQKHRTSCTIHKKELEENHVVGWPPIKSWRKKQLHQHQGGQQIKNDPTARRTGGSNSLYVKVKMEGEAIARKIDLRLYHSYQTLTNTLISMFAKYPKMDKDGATYTLTYQDDEGDWLLAGDVPWQTFIESVKRLEILRTGG
ncbi:auxin-responsive protein IAA28 [Corylus avellana]|uniref:auxin-responsive protein IAA28 n=1 Tax=Corylus avellana TaxID=13451 RepID=UPI00286C12D4|nr:auxin-responsive protein IAA28 [Corylus avellana]